MKFISEMFRGRSGKVNSKIVLGFLAFVVSVVYGFMDKELGVIIAFLTFSSTGLGWSAFDNKSAIQIQKLAMEILEKMDPERLKEAIIHAKVLRSIHPTNDQ